MLKVADFGTSRFLEIAAHGTTVIGSPPYMAPEQFHGKAVFASDIYSLGVTMYQMLTGVLPYDTPAPADLDKLMSGELVSPPRLKNPAIPKSISDIVMQRDGAGSRRRATSAPRICWTTCWRRAPRRSRGAHRPRRRRGRPRVGPSRGARDDAHEHPDAGCARARPPPRGSAGSAASRCTRAPIGVRSANEKQ